LVQIRPLLPIFLRKTNKYKISEISEKKIKLIVPIDPFFLLLLTRYLCSV
jgi:hypothetical protein